MKTEIEQRQYKRFVVLYALYKETKANANNEVVLSDLAASNDVKNGFYEEAKQYLKDELLIRMASKKEGFTITHLGKKIVEKVISFPDERTDIFPSFKDMGL